MDGARWNRIQDLFHRAADLPFPQQTAFLQQACGDDPALEAEVRALLAEDARSDFLLEGGVAPLAERVLAPLTPAPGAAVERIGPYRIVGVVGEGGMGVVYRGEREDLGSVAAIKVLRDAWLSPARRSRFAGEQRLLAQLNHPSIARLYDADTLPDGTPWFAMEYVDGEPLTTYCRSRGSSIPERLRLFREVCEAVRHAHRHLIIHRDLKPSNVLVTPDGAIKLLDFGISKRLEEADRSVDVTLTSLRMMTPAYAAPEQIRGGPLGLHTDVYALGVILYELLTGLPPFDFTNRTPGEIEALILEGTAVRPSWAAREGSARRRDWADLDVLCLTAMHKEPARRYGTVDALIRDIDHYLKNEPLEARPDSIRYRLGKFGRRHWRAVAGTTAMVAVVVALVAFYTVRLATARNAALAEAARTERIQQFMSNLFQGGDEVFGPAEDLRVVTLVDRGVKEARSLGSDPAVRAELYETLGNIYQRLGRFEQADALLKEALEKRRTLFGSVHPTVAETLVSLGLLRDAQAKYEEAERLIRQGLDMSRATLPRDHPAVGTALAALGQVLEDRGAYQRAIPVLDEAVKLQASQAPATPDLASSLIELANVHFYVGHYAESEALNRRAVAVIREAHGDRHPLVGDALINLGAVQFEQGHYEPAERLYRQGLEILASWYGKDHQRTAAAMTMVGRALVAQKRIDEASGLLREALAINERVYGKVHPRVASTLNELGRIALQRGDLDEAEASFTRMASIYRAVYGEGHYLIGIAQSNLGSVYLERQDYRRAEQILGRVVEHFTRTLSADHLNTGIARVKLGRALVRRRRYREAEHQLLAAYGILQKQANPTLSWLKWAREDLATVYVALGQPERAEQFRRENAGQ